MAQLRKPLFARQTSNGPRTVALLAAIGILAGMLGTGLGVSRILGQGQTGQQGSKTSSKDDQEIKKILQSTGSRRATGPGLFEGTPGPGGRKKEPPKTDPEAVVIVNSYLGAIGGTEVLNAIQDRKTRFTNIKYAPTGETIAELLLYLKRGYKFREEWDIKGFNIGEHPLAFVQIYNGELEEGWVQMFGTVSALEGRTLQVFVWDKYIDDFFTRWEGDGYTLQMAGEAVIDGEPMDIIRVQDFAARQTVRYFFSRKTGLLIKKEWIDTAQKEPARKEQFYRKYTRIRFSDGSGRSILFPLQVEIMLHDDIDTERIYTEVKFNSNLNDKLFAKPAGVPFGQHKPPKRKDGTGPNKAKKPEGSAPRGRKKREGSAPGRGSLTTPAKTPAKHDHDHDHPAERTP